MGRRGRHRFLDHWHRRSLVLDDGDTLHWVLIDDPRAPRPHAECFRTDRRGPIHASVAVELLRAAGHADAEHVALDDHVGGGRFH